MLKYIFSVLLLTAIWVTVWLLGLPTWIGIVASVVVVVVLATVVIVQLVRARRAAKEIERALAAQADKHAARARPDLAADVQALKIEFVKAVEALKTSKLGGKKGTAALYALPWYMIIGPPGSGKSTALRESGLRFPYMSKGGMVQGVGGTRNCHWWMTNEAVILDTAGRYTTEDADHEEWLAFLEMLKKNRPKQPVNGVLVAISIVDLMDVGKDSVVAQAREIRTRIDEVMNRLEMVVPVYVLFTKCDLLPGFVEMFSDLGANERHQIWGFTFPASKKIPDPTSAFAEFFVELADGAEKRALKRMGEERRIESRDKIYAFPQHFSPLADNLATFVGELLAENIYSESPVMRGCYFTSGTQEGSPIDRIMSKMAQAFGIQPRLSGTAIAQPEPKSYFLTDVFSKIIFPDKVIARRTAKHERKRMMVVHGVGLALLAVAFALAVLPVSAFQRNRDFLGDSREAVDKVNEHFLAKQEGEQTETIISAPRLAPLQETVDMLAEWEDDGPPTLMLMGMYKGADVYAGMRDLYHTTLHEELVEKIHDHILVYELDLFVQKHMVTGSPAPRNEHDKAKRLLRLYLHLTGEKAEEEPALTDEHKTWLVDELTQTWKLALQNLGEGSEDTVAYHDRMHAMAETYVSILAADSSKLFKRKDQLVADVREILQRLDPGDELLDRLIEDSKQKDLELFALTGSKRALKHYDKRKIRGAFTRFAWNKEIRIELYKGLDELLGADEWVIGRSREQAEEEQALIMARLRSRYFARYIDEWQRFLNAIKVEEPTNDSDALELLKDLTRGGNEPFTKLCQQVRYHTNLQPPPKPKEDEAAEGLVDAVTEEAGKKLENKAPKIAKHLPGVLPGGKRLEDLDPTLKFEHHVRDHFIKLSAFGSPEPPPPPPTDGEAPPPPPPSAVALDTYHTELRTLRSALEDKINSADEQTRKALARAAKTARANTDSLIIDSDTGQWQATLEKWLRPPIRAVERISSREQGASEALSYCTSIVEPFDDLKGYYPFKKGARNEVTLDAFSEFFKPGDGKVWTFYDNVLSSRIRKTHEGFEVKTAGAAERNKLNTQVAKFLTAAADVRDVMYPDGGDARFDFRVLVDGSTGRGVDRTIFIVDGQKITYRNTPLEYQDMTWPGADSPIGGTLKVVGIVGNGNVTRPGDWGFFRLLEEGTSRSTGRDRTFTFRWDLSDQDAGTVTIKFEPKLRDTPLFGVAERPVGKMEVFRHPDLTPPRNLHVGGKACGK